MAKIIYSDGREKTVFPRNGKDFSLEELQKVVDGYIEVVMLSDGRLMVVNEEGKLYGLPINKRATLLYGTVIVGDVLVCDNDQLS